MARVKYSALISSMSGSVGSATFQNTRAGPIVRNRPRSSKNPTAVQLQRRSLMMRLHYAWSDLTEDQRYAWNKFIDFSGASIRRDKSIRMTGHALFLKYNYIRLLSGLSLVETVYYNPISEIPLLLEIENAAGDFTIRFDTSEFGSSIWFIIKLTSARPASNVFSSRGLRFIPISPAVYDEYDIKTAYLNIFGVLPPVGSFVHYSVQHYSMISPVLAGKLTGVMEIT